MSISRRKLVLAGGSGAALSGLPWASGAATKTKAARDQLKNPATRAGFSSINCVTKAWSPRPINTWRRPEPDAAKLK